MLKSITAVAALFVVQFLCAQEVLLKGFVRDSITNEALIGVNVVYAPGKGTATDVNGAYALTLPVGPQTISFSFVGYQAQTVRLDLPMAASVTRDVRLKSSANQLDMVVVSAGKFEQRVGEVTQSLSVLRPDIIQNKNVFALNEALDQVPGVVVVDEDPQIRAGSGFSYGAGSRVQVLVDDIPILSGDIGRPNWTFLPLENIEQVEVIKGASSVLYGSAALSGVINVRTAYPRAEPRTRVNVFSGMYDTPGHAPAKWWGDNGPIFGGANFSHSRQIGKLDLVLGGNAFGDGGYVGPDLVDPDSLAVDPYRLGPGGYERRVRFNTGLRWRNGKIKGLTYGVNLNAMESRSSSIFIWSDTDAGLYRPEPGTVTTTRGMQYYLDPFITYHSKAGTRHSLRGRFHRQVFDNNNDQSNSNEVMHGEYQVQQKLDLFGETVITAGLLARNVESQALLYSGDTDGDGINSADNLAAYVQVDKKLFNKLAISGGVRYEQFTVNEDEVAQPVFRAGATYQVHQATYLRASYGQGFRFPTIGERFISTSVGKLVIYPNEELRPEQSWNVEAGVKQGFKVGSFMGYFDAVVFQQDFADYVEFTFGQWAPTTVQFVNGQLQLDPGLGFKSVNTGGARVTGLELELAGKGKLGPIDLTVLMGYTTTKPISTTPEQVYALPVSQASVPYSYRTTSFDTTDNILKFRVQQLFRSDIQFGYKRLQWGLSTRYNSHVRNIDRIFVDLDEVESDVLSLRTGVGEWMRTHTTGDWIVDARIGAQLTEQVRVMFIVNNLGNEVYSLRPLAIEAPRSMQVQLSMVL
ncbi:MAG: TonB-dependent receptor [Flavobacteriales bacterium]|nr:TonB-dependent receptor [Flavobacteriales bacterium]